MKTPEIKLAVRHTLQPGREARVNRTEDGIVHSAGVGRAPKAKSLVLRRMSIPAAPLPPCQPAQQGAAKDDGQMPRAQPLAR